MFRKDFLLPALIGLGLYSQGAEVALCNNTTILLALFVLLQNHSEIEDFRARMDYIERRDCCCAENFFQPVSFNNGCPRCSCRSHRF
jgi:hypothetical protein